jgi:predicted O-methyltransferase YrrM
MRKYRKSLCKFEKRFAPGMHSWGIFAPINTCEMIFHLLIHRITAHSFFAPDPFIQDFRCHVLDDTPVFSDYAAIEKIRSRLLKDASPVVPVDFGAGTRSIRKKRTVGQITREASVNARYGRLLNRLAHHYKPSGIIELGTATGISTMYLASGNRDALVTTVEGNPQLAKLAARNFSEAGLKNVTVMNTPFDEVVPHLVQKMPPDSLVYIDGNHTEEATLRYYQLFAGHTGNAILIFDDINWSPGMRSAWTKIRQQVPCGVLIDLFFMGIYFSNISSPVKFHRINY